MTALLYYIMCYCMYLQTNRIMDLINTELHIWELSGLTPPIGLSRTVISLLLCNNMYVWLQLGLEMGTDKPL